MAITQLSWVLLIAFHIFVTDKAWSVSFFEIQQFITQADCGSYNITMLHKKEIAWKRKGKGNEKEKGEK